MTEIKFEGSVTISRDSTDTVNIYFIDENSRSRFLTASLTLEDYARVISGQGNIECRCVVRQLDTVGKKKVQEKRKVKYQGKTYDRDLMAQFLLDTCQEEGWILDPYLRSQDSVTYTDGEIFLNYTVYKYVDTNEPMV
jgi:hypothetical protein